mmetsp:Transcript_1440/g.2836  ORF Transcript_1440/g.2836 Transcript_1440/m.2836 type:complete len:370 (+) Transcript_1440:462-1571(+)
MPWAAAKRRTQRFALLAATCRKVCSRALACRWRASGMRSKSMAKSPSAGREKGWMLETRWRRELPFRACFSARSTPWAASCGNCRSSMTATSARWKAQASQSTEWPWESRVRPETRPPCWMMAASARTSPSVMAFHRTSGAMRCMFCRGPTAWGRPCRHSLSSCSVCVRSWVMPSARSDGCAAPCTSRASSRRTTRTSGEPLRATAMAWSSSAETMGAAPRARRSRPRSTRSGPCAAALSSCHAVRSCSKAWTTADRATSSPAMACFAAPSLFSQRSRCRATARIPFRASVGHPARSRSASERKVFSLIRSAFCSTCWSSPGCILGRCLISSTLRRTASMSSATWWSFCCTTAPRACGKGPGTARCGRA